MSLGLHASFESAYDQVAGIGAEQEFIQQAFNFIAEKNPAFFNHPNYLKQIQNMAKKAHDLAMENNKKKQEIVEEFETPAVKADPVPVQQPQPVTETTETVPVGNGGKTDKYVWTQSLAELTVIMQVPLNTRAKDLVVEIKPQHLKVGIKGQTMIINV
jgi:hypothetical protein